MDNHVLSTVVVLVTIFVLVPQFASGENSWNPSNLDIRDIMYAELYEELAEELAALSTSEPGVGRLSTTSPNTMSSSINAKTPLKAVKPRQPESEDKVLPQGFQFVSGGAGEGSQHLKPQGSVTNKQEVKSDEGLPAYCSPPNPCPKGKTAADGCQENIADVAEFNRDYIGRQMRAGHCSCDHEHMNPEFCSLHSDQRSSAGVASDEISEVFDDILEGEFGKNPYISVGGKRENLTAKKGGQQHILHKRSGNQDDLGSSQEEKNPYLQGDRLPVVAKKSPKME